MEGTDTLKLIRIMQQYNNQAIFKWTKATNHNLGISPILVLAELKHKGPQKQTELAHTLGYTPGALTNIANKLIVQELAERIYDQNDRRSVIMKITDKGRQVLQESETKGHALHAELFQVLSEDELKRFLAIYEKLVNNMDV
ncbi:MULTISPECIES: MarR family winged helix-turn-helix transcriptional regulator [Bacillus]|uniref:MarR family winged helix-turn-helix transcriptional regulator n=1 Tax=Bacillus TaxID=1386 RepID=UPI0002FBD222|nr:MULTISPECIES: MarR family transcriptional regulator [Bacillus]